MSLSANATEAQLWAALNAQSAQLAKLTADVGAITPPTTLFKLGVDAGWTLASSYLCFLLTLGFALLSAGSAKAINAKNAMSQVSLACVTSALGFFTLGFGVSTSTGATANLGIGDMTLAGVHDEQFYAHYIFLFCFCNAACTIVCTAVTSRISMRACIVLCLVISSFSFPIAAHWVWGHGWLSIRAAGALQFLDFAGGTVTHVVGGVSAFTAAYIVGARYDRFVRNEAGQMEDRREPGHSVVFAFLGTLLLWFAWFGLNSGSTLAVSGNQWQVAALTAINNVLAAGTGSLTITIWHMMSSDVHNLWELLNGILCGLVAITSGCAYVDPWAAIVIGALSVPCYRAGVHMLDYMRVDDVVDAFAVHACCGAFGTLATALLSTQANIDAVYGPDVLKLRHGHQLGIQLLGLLVVAAMACAATALPLLLMKRVLGVSWVRVQLEDETVGLDGTLMGGWAYPDFHAKMLTAKNQVMLEAELGAALKAGDAKATAQVTEKIRELDEQRKQALKNGTAGRVDVRAELSKGGPVSKRVGGNTAGGSTVGRPAGSAMCRETTPKASGVQSGANRRTLSGGAPLDSGVTKQQRFLSVDSNPAASFVAVSSSVGIDSERQAPSRGAWDSPLNVTIASPSGAQSMRTLALTDSKSSIKRPLAGSAGLLMDVNEGAGAQGGASLESDASALPGSASRHDDNGVTDIHIPLGAQQQQHQLLQLESSSPRARGDDGARVRHDDHDDSSDGEEPADADADVVERIRLANALVEADA